MNWPYTSFPFIRFTNWKQVAQINGSPEEYVVSFHSYASRIGSKSSTSTSQDAWTIWSFHSYASRIGSKCGTNRSEGCCKSFHSYASRIGSKMQRTGYLCVLYNVSIHTLHELEASFFRREGVAVFVRFHSYASRIGSKKIHTEATKWHVVIRFHSYASRIGSKTKKRSLF